MKYLVAILTVAACIYGCSSGKNTMSGDEASVKEMASNTVRIANDELEYEIIIIDPGFQNWLVTQPPEGFYSLNFLEGRNRLFVTEFNRRVQNFQLYDRTLYELEINYDFDVDYGYEVNYLLYNYLEYFQWKYNQSFIGGRRGARQ